mgnify:CR=1 FL=1
MIMDKRSFLKKLGILGLAVAPSAYGIERWIDIHSDISAGDLAFDEDFWTGIRKGYRLKPDYINLENGYYCMQPQEVLEKYIKHVRDINYEASYYFRTVQWENRNKILKQLSVAFIVIGILMILFFALHLHQPPLFVQAVQYLVYSFAHAAHIGL